MPIFSSTGHTFEDAHDYAVNRDVVQVVDTQTMPESRAVEDRRTPHVAGKVGEEQAFNTLLSHPESPRIPPGPVNEFNKDVTPFADQVEFDRNVRALGHYNSSPNSVVRDMGEATHRYYPDIGFAPGSIPMETSPSQERLRRQWQDTPPPGGPVDVGRPERLLDEQSSIPPNAMPVQATDESVNWSQGRNLQWASDAPTNRPRGGSTPITTGMVGTTGLHQVLTANQMVGMEFQAMDQGPPPTTEALTERAAARESVGAPLQAPPLDTWDRAMKSLVEFPHPFAISAGLAGFAAGNVARSTAHAFQTFDAALHGRISTDTGNPEMAGMSLELAGLAVMGPAPLVRQVVDGSLGSMAGVRAATANQPRLIRAQALEANGAHPNKIWEETGWWHNPIDNHWKWEVSSQNARLTAAGESMSHGTGGRLPTFFRHPELYEAYPWLRDVVVKVDNKLEGMGALTGIATSRHGRDVPHIELNMRAIREAGESPVMTILHEVQHAIQQHEGFAQSSNAKARFHQVLEDLTNARREAFNRGDYASAQQYSLEHEFARTHTGSMYDRLYNRAPAEIEARMVEARFEERQRRARLGHPFTSDVMVSPHTWMERLHGTRVEPVIFPQDRRGMPDWYNSRYYP